MRVLQSQAAAGSRNPGGGPAQPAVEGRQLHAAGARPAAAAAAASFERRAGREPDRRGRGCRAWDRTRRRTRASLCSNRRRGGCVRRAQPVARHAGSAAAAAAADGTQYATHRQSALATGPPAGCGSPHRWPASRRRGRPVRQGRGSGRHARPAGLGGSGGGDGRRPAAGARRPCRRVECDAHAFMGRRAAPGREQARRPSCPAGSAP